LIELMVAAAIFALVFAAVSLGIGRALDVNRNNRNRSAASYLAARGIEESRSAAFGDIVPGSASCSYQTPQTDCSFSVPSAPYTVKREVSWVAPGAISNTCNVPSGSSGSALAYKRVTVTVTWPDMRGVTSVASQTLLTPPSAAYDPNNGHIVVRLFDRNAQPLVGQVVSLSGPASDSQVSTEDGCAFFAYLDPGTYTVSLNTAGYVGRQGDQPATETVAVVESQTTVAQLTYDRAATLQVTLAPPVAPPTAALPDGIAVTIYNTNLTVPTKSFTGSGLSRTITPLFPYASGYEVWAGSCADADPTIHGFSRGSPLIAAPGGTASRSVALGAVDVQVTRTVSGVTSGVSTSTVRAEHDPVGGACPSGAATLTTSTPTGSDGRIRLALPYGRWKIRTTAPRTGLSASVTLSPGNPVQAVTVGT
jgi:type II secretory pathway pseudopilin PulG